ncbi:MAG: guanylate kinase [Gemmatimonadales bacterium]
MPFLVVLSSPSGGGKTTIARRLLAERSDVAYSISATTRPIRPEEVDGIAYHFLARTEFERRVAAGEFLEWAEYGSNLYGTLRAEVDRGIQSGRQVILDIEVQGAEKLRGAYQNAVHIFVLPPSGSVLAERLKGRGTEPAEAVRRRLTIAADELTMVDRYDYVVVNDDLDEAVRRVGEIIDAERARPRRLDNLATVVGRMRQQLGAPADR